MYMENYAIEAIIGRRPGKKSWKGGKRHFLTPVENRVTRPHNVDRIVENTRKFLSSIQFSLK